MSLGLSVAVLGLTAIGLSCQSREPTPCQRFLDCVDQRCDREFDRVGTICRFNGVGFISNEMDEVDECPEYEAALQNCLDLCVAVESISDDDAVEGDEVVQCRLGSRLDEEPKTEDECEAAENTCAS